MLFQMFFGMPARIVNAEGKAIQGTLGFVGALLKIIRRVQPTHLVVLFDGECENKRLELDAEYKANRPDYSQMPEEENPYSQLPDIYKALDYLGIRYMETSTCETDDVIAGYTLAYGSDCEIVISSFDSDFFSAYYRDGLGFAVSWRKHHNMYPCIYAREIWYSSDPVCGLQSIGRRYGR